MATRMQFLNCIQRSRDRYVSIRLRTKLNRFENFYWRIVQAQSQNSVTGEAEINFVGARAVADLGGGMGGMHPPHQPKSNDFGRKISLYFE